MFLHFSLYPQSELELQESSGGVGWDDSFITESSDPFVKETGFENWFNPRHTQPKDNSNRKIIMTTYLINMLH